MTEPGDTEAFRRLFEENYQMLLAFAIRRTGGFADAQDVVSEVFSVAWRRVVDLPATSDQRRMWLFGIAQRVMANRRRSYRRYWRLVGRLDSTSAGTNELLPDGLEREDVALALQALELLSPADQELILLSVWEELSHSAIAEILGISNANVSVRLHRAKERLRGAYDEVVRGRALSSVRAESAVAGYRSEEGKP